MSALQYHQTGPQEDLYEVPRGQGEAGAEAGHDDSRYAEVTRDRVDEPSSLQESETYRKFDNPLYGDRERH